MKSIIYNVLIAVSMLVAIPVYAQNNNDSYLARSAKEIQMKLGLADSVAGKLLTSMTGMMHDMQMIGASTNLEDRKVQMHRIRSNYNAQVKSMLTPQQWTLYQQLEAGAREKFRNQMKAKKVPVKELE